MSVCVGTYLGPYLEVQGGGDGAEGVQLLTGQGGLTVVCRELVQLSLEGRQLFAVGGCNVCCVCVESGGFDSA